MLFASIPILCFFGIYYAISLKNFTNDGWRGGFLLSAAVWATLLLAITETLSYFKLIVFWAVILGWIVGTGIVLLFIDLMGLHESDKKTEYPQREFGIKNLVGFDRFLLFSIFIVISVSAVIAWFSPPNNSDSLIYHMSRVAHWMQNQSIAFYPTYTTRQLYQGPWAEYAILHFQILSKGDYLANFVQWASMVGSIIGVSAIAEQFGAGRKGQIISAAISAIIPMGILQTSSTQNNWVVAFWLVLMLYFFNQLRNKPEFLNAVAMGAGFGFSILTKATAYLFAFPFIFWVGIWEIATVRPIRLKYSIAIVLVAITLNASHLYRNFQLTGNPLGSTREETKSRSSYVNDVINVRSTASNIVRNIALHLGTPIDEVNSKIWNVIDYVHTHFIGMDVNDRRTTWIRTKFYVFRLNAEEDIDGNPLHLFLIGFSFLYLFSKARKNRDRFFYSLGLSAGFILFCTILKWQPWHSRLHLPLFVLWSPLIGVILEKAKYQALSMLYLLLLIAVTIPYLLFQNERPLLGSRSILSRDRNLQYIYYNDDLAKSFISSAKYISSENCPDIGLILSNHSPEYPLWALTRKFCINHKITIAHINVNNESKKLESEFGLDQFMPTLIISFGRQRSEISYRTQAYKLSWSAPPIFIYHR